MWVAEANDQMALLEGTGSTLVLLAVVVSWIVVALVAYWVIRLAVRHALRDVSGSSSSRSEGQG
ncbi:hypothetical protein P0Y31_06910 [Knoellia sp. 3-2P3]|uniref:hypothetical protein n=1 Tax=unclassified Knoellia TaxID=2618719 RepID=UPI0023DC7CE0|nr:hypothetical protein [Knoellia sp. 3-2P3]MDF2092069.1 hypothetical protein [Knoellia sp. 3-2P3]